MAGNISDNTSIGLAVLLSIPFFVLWSALSFKTWFDIRDITRWSIKNYRLAVSCFLVMTTLFMIDSSRVRFKWVLFGLHPIQGSLITLCIRWIWLLTIIWCTCLLYGYTARSIVAKVRRPALQELAKEVQREDPFISREEVERESERLDNLLVRLREEWDRIAVVSARIEQDRPILVPRDRSRRSGHEQS